MKKHLFVFGFQEPHQIGTDDEDSEAVYVRADLEQTALAWGREVAEGFVKRLFRDEAISWKDLGYAHWVEASLEPGEPNTSKDAPEVSLGEYPDFDDWIDRRRERVQTAIRECRARHPS